MTYEELVFEYQNGNNDVLMLLIEKFESQMEWLSLKWLKVGRFFNLDERDLQQEGWIAYVKCVESYEVRKEENFCTFYTYAYRLVEFSMRSCIAKNRPSGYKRYNKDEDTNLLIPCSIYSKSFDTENASSLLDNILDDESENAFENAILRQDILTLLDEVFNCSICMTSDINNDFLLKELCNRILPQNIICLHYGLFGKAFTFTEIAQKTQLSASYIAEVEQKALSKIRNSIPGKQFLNIYRHNQIESLLQKKHEINYLKNPESIVVKMDSVDELLKKYI